LGVQRFQADDQDFFENEAQYATLGSFVHKTDDVSGDNYYANKVPLTFSVKCTFKKGLQPNGCKPDRKTSEYDIPDIDGVPSFVKKCVEFIEYEGISPTILFTTNCTVVYCS